SKDGKAKDKKGKEKEKESEEEEKPPPPVRIGLEGHQERLSEVHVPPGDYATLTANEDRLYWLSSEPGVDDEMVSLLTVPFDSEKTDPSTVMEDVDDYRLAADGKKLLLQKEDTLYVFDAGEEAPKDEELQKS